MRYRHFESTVMPFGLTNASTVVMNRVCKPYLDKFVIMFIDNIIIFSKSKEEHEVSLKVVLELLKKEELFAKLSKCEIRLQEVHFFGQVVNNSDFHVDPSKIKVVKNWKVLRQLKIHEKNYTTHDLEFGAIVSALRTWRHYIDYDCEIRYHPRKANIVVRAISRKERVKSGRLREMAMTIQSRVKRMILVAQSGAFKEKNKPTKRLHGLDQQMESKEDGGCTLWTNYGIHWLIGPELVQETIDKVVLVKENLKAARDRLKSYASNKIKRLELRISPVAYKLSLPEELSEVHDTFHVSNLKKCLANANLHVPLEEIKIEKKTFVLLKNP
nr:putative reverse transcriptase domain-containing protein [Tanacetum cinerariifolium]